MTTLYERDFYAWGKEQLSFLLSGSLKSLDLKNIIEEFDSVVRREKNELKSKLAVLIAHLLKWKYQPQFRSKSWKDTIGYCRMDVEFLLESSPSLENEIKEFWSMIYKKAKKRAQAETGLLREFPDECPFTQEQVKQEDWLPEDGE